MISSDLPKKDSGRVRVGRRDRILQGELKMNRILLTLGFASVFAASSFAQMAAPSAS